MLAGDHKLIATAIVIMPDGSYRLQLTEPGGKWSHLCLEGKVANSLRQHLQLPMIATEPCYNGKEEPYRGFP